MTELNQEVMRELGELKGEFNGLHHRLNTQDQTVTNLHAKSHSELVEHEAREESRLTQMSSQSNERFTNIEKQLETIKRVMWFGIAGASIVGGAISIRLITISTVG